MRFCGLFVLSLTLVGCGQSEPTATPGKRAKKPGELNQPGKWAKELGELNQQIAVLPREDLDADRKAMVKWLKTRPEYEASGESRFGNAWARFTDGRMVVIPFVHAGMRGGSPDSPIDPTYAASATQDPPTGTSNVRYLVPVSRQARLLTADFDGVLPPLVSPVALLKEYLSPAGYTTLEEKATVTALKAVQGDGIFYIDTHAFSLPNRQGEEVFGFATSLGPEASEEDLESGRLIYLKTGGSGASYLITAQFVRQYMSFGENAFVFINACGSESNEPFRKAFLEKGAAFYAGWTRPVSDASANIVSKFLFDRLLGANLFSLDREDPKQRPFDYMLVWADMQQRQYNLDRFQRRDDPDVRGSQPLVPETPRPDPRAELRIHSGGIKGHGGLRPIITAVQVDVFKEELIINGTFGAMPDEVTVGGKPVTVKQFIEGGDVVICALPPSGDGSAGPVIAKVRGKASNAVPLTEWRIRFRYTEELTEFEPPLKKTAVIDVHLRLDMHAFRVAPHSTPIGLLPGSTTLAASDSKVQWRFSGAGKHKMLTFLETHALSGSGSMTSGEGVADQKGVLTFEGGIDPSKKAFLKTRLFVIVHKAGVERVTSPASESDLEVALSFESPGTDMFLDANLGIRAGSVTWQADNSKMNLEWDDAPARFAPTADTLARAVPDPDRDEEAAAAAPKGQARDTATIAETRPFFTAQAVRTSRTPDSAGPRGRAPTSGP